MANGYTSAERRSNVRKQLRDRKGRWIEMGAKVRFTLDGLERAGEIVDIDYDNDEAVVAYRGKTGKLTEAKVKGRAMDVVANKATLDATNKKATLPDSGTDKDDSSANDSALREKLDAEIAELEADLDNLKDINAPAAERKEVNDQLRAKRKEREALDGTPEKTATPAQESAPTASPEDAGESIDVDDIDGLEDGTTVRLHDTANDNDITTWRKDRGSWLGYDDSGNEHELSDDELKDYINERDPKDITAHRDEDDDSHEAAEDKDKDTDESDALAPGANRRSRRKRDRDRDRGLGPGGLPHGDDDDDSSSDDEDEPAQVPATEDAEEAPISDEPKKSAEATIPEDLYAPGSRLTDPGVAEAAPVGTRATDDSGEGHTRLGKTGWRNDSLEPVSSEDLVKRGATVNSSIPVANSEGDLRNGETKTGLDPDTVTQITDPKIASRLADTVEGDDKNSEFIRNALHGPSELGDEASVYVKTDSDGNVVGAASAVEYSFDPRELDPDSTAEPFDYLKLDYVGSKKGSGSGSALVARILDDARQQNRGVLLEATSESIDYWEKKQGFKEDPYGAGMSAVGLTPDQINDYFDAKNTPEAGKLTGPDADLNYEDSHSELVPAEEIAGDVDGAVKRLDDAPAGAATTDAAGDEYQKDEAGDWTDTSGTSVNSKTIAERGADLPAEDKTALTREQLDGLPNGIQVENTDGDGFIKAYGGEWIDDDGNRVGSADVAKAGVSVVPGQAEVAERDAPATTSEFTPGKAPALPDGVSVVDNFDADYSDPNVDLSSGWGDNSGYRPSGEAYRLGDSGLAGPDLDRLPLGAEVSAADGSVYQKNRNTGNWDRLDPTADEVRREASWTELDAAQGDEGFTFDAGREHSGSWSDVSGNPSEAPTAAPEGKNTPAEDVEVAPEAPKTKTPATQPDSGEGAEDDSGPAPGEAGPATPTTETELEPAEDGVVKTTPDGRKYVAAAGGEPLFEGDRVVSANDALSGVVVRIEGNGKYVQVLGDDGKKRGRRANSLEKQADTQSVTPEAKAGKQAPITEVPGPNPNDKRLIDADGVPYVMSADDADELRVGDQVQSRTDGLSGEIVTIEKNGAYVKVKGKDGKIRGRKADTLDKIVGVSVDVTGEGSGVEELQPGLFMNHDTGRKFVQNSSGLRFHALDTVTDGVDNYRVETAHANASGKPILFLERLDPDGAPTGFSYVMSGKQLDNLFNEENAPSISDSTATPESTGLTPGDYAAKMYALNNFELAGAPEQGAMGLVHFIALPDGSNALVKSVTGTHWKEWTPDTANMSNADALDHELQAEYLGAKLAEALGISNISSAIVPGSTDKVVHQVVPGINAYDVAEDNGANIDDILNYQGGYDTAGVPGFESLDYTNGREIALFDYLTGYEDRHLGNWFIDEDNKTVYPVDFGAAWIDTSDLNPGPSPFYYYWFDPDFAPSTWTSAELAELRGKVEDLEDAFYAAGKGAWFNITMKRFDDLESGAPE